jgi:hypothetical protein|tara:strand:+ start:517 stop:1131 length:615 start_codon:yes stop_codon:yes gene_type:complete
MKQVFKSLLGTAFIYVIVSVLAVTLTMQQFLPVMAYMVAFTSMLQLSGVDFFEDLYKHSPDNILSTVCSLVFNILTVAGILYIAISHTITKSKEPLVGVIYGIVLYALLFPIAKFGMMKLMTTPEEPQEEDEKPEPLEHREVVLNLVRGSLFIALLAGLHFGYGHIVNSLVKTRRTSNNGLINDMIRNRYSLTNLPVKSNRGIN